MSKYEQQVSEAPASVTILTAEEIRKYGVTDLMEALQLIRSVYISYDRNYAYIGLRGFSRPTDYNNRLLVTMDGVPMNESIWGGASLRQDFYALNMDEVERIEVVRGANSALYGSSAMIGIINVVTKQGKHLDGLQVNLQGGSYGRLAGQVAWGKGTAKGLDLTVSVRAGKTAGQRLYFPEYDTDSTLNGVADHLDGSQFVGAHITASYKGFHARAFFTDHHVGVPTASFASLFGDDRLKVIDRQGFLDLGYTLDLDRTKTIVLRDYVSAFQFRGDYPAEPTPDGVFSIHASGLWNTAEARLQWDVASNNRLIVGLSSQQHAFADYETYYGGEQLSDTTIPYLTYSAYVQDEYQPFRWLVVTAGLRYDRLYLGKQALTPRVGLLLNPKEGTTIKLLLANAFRAPNISESSLEDDTDKGNPNLESEFIQTQEIAVEQRLGDYVYLTASGYRMVFTNLIDRVEVPGSLNTYGNIGSAKGLGAELEGMLRLRSGNRVFTSGSYTLFSNDSTGWLTNSPRFIWKTGACVNLLKHFTWGSEGTLETPRRTVVGTQTPVLLLWNASLSFHPQGKSGSAVAKVFQHSTWSFKVLNVLDHGNYHPGGLEHLQPAIRQNGRNYLMTCRWQF